MGAIRMGVARPKRVQKAWARWRAVMGRKTLLFLKKKKQKDLYDLVPGFLGGTGARL
jgi:hypothetical protein